MNALSALLPTHAMFVAAAAATSPHSDDSSIPVVRCPHCYQVGIFIRDRNFADGSGVVWMCTTQGCKGLNLYYYPSVPNNERGSVQFLDRVSQLQHRVTQFQLSRFATQTLDGRLAHLAREVAELRQQPDDLTEWADVLILLLGAAACRGLTVNDLVDAAQVKMHINEKRTWPAQPDAEGVYHHTNCAQSV